MQQLPQRRRRRSRSNLMDSLQAPLQRLPYMYPGSRGSKSESRTAECRTSQVVTMFPCFQVSCRRRRVASLHRKSNIPLANVVACTFYSRDFFQTYRPAVGIQMRLVHSVFVITIVVVVSICTCSKVNNNFFIINHV